MSYRDGEVICFVTQVCMAEEDDTGSMCKWRHANLGDVIHDCPLSGSHTFQNIILRTPSVSLNGFYMLNINSCKLKMGDKGK